MRFFCEVRTQIIRSVVFGSTMYDSDSSYSYTASDFRSDEDEIDYDTDDYDDSDDSYNDGRRILVGSAFSSEESETDDDIYYEADLRPTSVPRLEKMASCSAAIGLLNNATVAIPGMITNHSEWRKLLDDEVPKWIDALPIPKSFAKCIEKQFNNVKFNADEWISYIFRAVFFKKGVKSDLYRHIECIVWHSNNSINSVETARNLLKSDKLTNVEKFRLACTYCLREDIERMWRITDKNAIMDKFRFFEYPSICYWKRYCAEKLDKIRARRKLYKDDFMIQQRFVDNWPAIEYFFDRLNAEQQVLKVIWFIDKREICFQKLLLMKLNESLRLRVIMERLAAIMCNYAFADSDDSYEDVIRTWNDVRNLITQNQFVELFTKLLDNKTESFILTEIWNTTPDDFKRYIFNYNYVNFIKKVMRWLANKRAKELAFVSSLLLESASVDMLRKVTKQRFFSKECCRRFIYYYEVELLDQLINVFLPEAAESTNFKLSLAKTPYFGKCCKKLMMHHEIRTLVKLLNFGFSKTDSSSVQFVRQMLDPHMGRLNYQCSIHYSTGNLNGLNDFLAPLISSYPEIVSEYKTKLLFSHLGFNACVNHFGSTKDVLDGIIADGLPPELATEWKKKIIFSPEGIDKLRNMIVNLPLSDAEKCARWFLESDDDRKKLRTILFDRMKEEKSCAQPKIREKYEAFLL